MNWGDAIRLAASIVVCEGAGGVGAIFTTKAIPTWYAGLKKPSFTPPNAVFGPIWITLYLLMAVSVFLVWRRGFAEPGATSAFAMFWVQLALNTLWSAVFFGLKSIFGGVIVIVLLWLAILFTMISFFRISTLAGGLLVPYIVWVSIALNLNVRIWTLNRVTAAKH